MLSHITPAIFIGCGGSGVETVARIKKNLKNELARSSWGNDLPGCWQFVAIDVHPHELEGLTTDEAPDLMGRFTGSFQELETTFRGRYRNQPKDKTQRELLGWVPRAQDFAPLPQPVAAYRSVGRMFGLVSQDIILKALNRSRDVCSSSSSAVEVVKLSAQLGVEWNRNMGTPQIFVVGSMTGGIGSSMLIDVVELARTVWPESLLSLCVYTPDIFSGLQPTMSNHSAAANAATFVSELMSMWWGEMGDKSELLLSRMDHSRRPTGVFFLGAQNLSGHRYLNHRSAFEAAARYISATVTDGAQNDSHNAYTLVEFATRGRINRDSLGFVHAHEDATPGLAESFGCGTLSVGRTHFRAFLAAQITSRVWHLLHGFQLRGDTSQRSSLQSDPREALKIADEHQQAFFNELLPFLTENKTLTLSRVSELLTSVSKFVSELGIPVTCELLELVLVEIRTKPEMTPMAEFTRRLQRLLRDVLGSASDDTRPRNTSELVREYSPLECEIILEDPQEWPQRATELVQAATSRISDEDIDPILIAAKEIIQGKLPVETLKHSLPPLLCLRDQTRFEKVKHLEFSALVAEVDVSAISTAVERWIDQDGTPIDEYLRVGLNEYLDDRDAVGRPMPEYAKRLDLFRERLGSALVAAAPLMDIDPARLFEIHPAHPTGVSHSLEVVWNAPRFPFRIDHPAVQVVREVVAELTSINVDNLSFSDDLTEGSILFTTVMRTPVSPAVFKGITGAVIPVVRRLPSNRTGGASPELVHMWRYRRSRTLKQFVSLPYGLRLAAMRGYAIAQLLGVVGIDGEGSFVISSNTGVHQCPLQLMTTRERARSLIPFLLESMVLKILEMGEVGRSAILPYAELIAYGAPHQKNEEFTVEGLLHDVLEDGTYGAVKILNQKRASEFLVADKEQRIRTAVASLNESISYLSDVAKTAVTEQCYRTSMNSVYPAETLTLELIDEIVDAYTSVVKAIKKFGSSYDVSTID